MERSTYFANALPGIVVALALVTVSIRVVQPVYQTFALLLAGLRDHVPAPSGRHRPGRARAGAAAARRRLALRSGASPLSTARRVTLPLIAPGLGAGAALVFLAVATELTATLLLAPIEHDDPGHPVLVALVVGRVRRRGPVRAADGADLAAGHDLLGRRREPDLGGGTS